MNSTEQFKVQINEALLERAFANFNLVAVTVPRRTCIRAARRSMMKFRDQSKINAPVRNGEMGGSLKKSLGVKIKTWSREPTQGFAGAGPRGSGVVYAVVGPRSSYKVSSAKAFSEGLTKISYKQNKKGKTTVRASKGYTIQPSHYAHLVEFGHKTRTSKNPAYERNPSLPAKKSAAAAKPFMRGALRNVTPTAIALIFASEVRKGIDACDWNHSRCAIPQQPQEQLI